MEQGMLLDLRDISIPTLVMWGESDNWGKFEHAERWKNELGNATLVSYPSYGHVLMEEGAEITSADAIAFINDDPIPSIEGLGPGGSFSIDEAASDFDQEALFGTPPSADSDTSAEESADEVILMDAE